MLDDYDFALCLTHDVDRVYKTFQAPYYAIKERDPSHLKSLVTSERPYWQFEEIMELEEDLGVRSSFYFLNEQRLFRDKGPVEWLKPKNWKLYTGRYDITDEEIVDVIQTLDDGGWEIGLHGSYESYADLDRLRFEKKTLEEIVGHEVVGGRQHYLNLNRPKTWEYHREIGLKYDSSLGSTNTPGFQYGYQLSRPFDDEFVVFPLTAMEVHFKETRGLHLDYVQLLNEASYNNAIMTLLWHPRFFSKREFEGYRELYKDILYQALDMGAWIGPPGKLYEKFK